tara:strand:+ start:857 stop:1525 length:669 start_codon:yes stop_codon:yes gene_type:complete
MLSFKALTEKKKTEVKVNPKKDELLEAPRKKDMNHGEDCDCKICEAKRKGEEVHDGPDTAKVESVEPLNKTLTNQTAYDSHQEVSEESNQEERNQETSLVRFSDFNEATRLKKEKGYDKGGTRKPAPKPKDGKPSALDIVRASITKQYGKGAIMSSGSRQQKKVKGQKDERGTGKYKKAADAKKQTAADAKKRGFKSTQNYVDTMARYGGKDNYDKGRGLGT